MQNSAKLLLVGLAFFLRAAVGIAASNDPSPTPAEIRSSPAKRLAPDGVYFVLERIPVTTDSGVVSVSPGTRVTLLKAGSPMKVTDGKHVFSAFAFQLTNDPDIAKQLVRPEPTVQPSLPLLPNLPAPTPQPIQPSGPAQPVPGGQPPAIREGPGDQKGSHAPPTAEQKEKIENLRREIKRLRQEIQDYRPTRSYRGRIHPEDQHIQQRFIEKNLRKITEIKEEIRKLGGTATLD